MDTYFQRIVCIWKNHCQINILSLYVSAVLWYAIQLDKTEYPTLIWLSDFSYIIESITHNKRLFHRTHLYSLTFTQMTTNRQNKSTFYLAAQFHSLVQRHTTWNANDLLANSHLINSLSLSVLFWSLFMWAIHDTQHIFFVLISISISHMHQRILHADYDYTTNQYWEEDVGHCSYNWTVFCECRRACIRYQNATHDLDPFKCKQKQNNNEKLLSNRMKTASEFSRTICGWNKMRTLYEAFDSLVKSIAMWIKSILCMNSLWFNELCCFATVWFFFLFFGIRLLFSCWCRHFLHFRICAHFNGSWMYRRNKNQPPLNAFYWICLLLDTVAFVVLIEISSHYDDGKFFKAIEIKITRNLYRYIENIQVKSSDGLVHELTKIKQIFGHILQTSCLHVNSLFSIFKICSFL